MIRYLVVLAAGYVLGTKAGRRRYEQIAGTYKAVTESPAAKAVITGLKAFPRADQPPSLVVFYAFRLMVVLGLAMGGLGVWGAWLIWRVRRARASRWSW